MQRFVNDYFIQLTGPLAPAGGTLPIAAADAARLPMAAEDFYLLTLADSLDIRERTRVEIVKATAAPGGGIALVRQQESTQAGAFVAGDWVLCGPTAGTVAGLVAKAAQVDALAAQVLELQQRVSALEGGEPEPEDLLTDQGGNRLTDEQGNYLKGV
ncbi:MAG: hypothetical protein CTR55_10490 [Pseudomonas sp.]|uniref:hypothetical protein n=1 Tax=Pseudomonas sp. TaxID=306 RepID=UPI000CBABF48|nr:hypothetical protein [Pseudomonas sp.]PJI49759.1 MAG: hypothetical protein CTR55_10490 [Pseudomonas sp.]